MNNWQIEKGIKNRKFPKSFPVNIETNLINAYSVILHNCRLALYRQSNFLYQLDLSDDTKSGGCVIGRNLHSSKQVSDFSNFGWESYDQGAHQLLRNILFQ